MKYKSLGLNFFPAILILMFGVWALYLTHDHIHTVEVIQHDLEEFNKNFQEVSAAYEQVEIGIKRFAGSRTEEQKSVVLNALKNFSESLTLIIPYFDKKINTDSRWNELKANTGILRDRFSLRKKAQDIHVDGLIIHLNKTESALNSLYRLHVSKITQDGLSEDMRQRQVWVLLSVLLISVSGFVLVILNIHKLRALSIMDEERRMTLDDFKAKLAALEMARDGIVIIDKNMNLMFINKALCKISGLKESQKDNVIGQPWANAFSASDAEVIEEDIFPEIHENLHWIGEFPIYREDGSVLHTELSFTKLPDGGMIGTVQDITNIQKNENERKTLEEQFFQAQKMEAIGRLAGGFAHDFNNILAAMNGYAEFLIDDLEDNSSEQGYAKNILNAGLQARTLIDQMLAFSRRNDGRKEALDIIPSVHEVISLLRATMPKSINLNENCGVKSAMIEGNSTQLSQLIMNLCVNAQDAMENDTGTLDISVNTITASDLGIEELLQDKLPNAEETPYMGIMDVAPAKTRLVLGHMSKKHEYVAINVSDTGTGISRIVMERIFEPFFTTKPADKGTGLGLATVHGVIIGHRACMVIDSELGKGTSFNLCFPLAGSVEKIQPEHSVSAQNDNASEATQRHILLVEDQENVRDMTTLLLKRLGYDVTSTDSGMAGLDAIRKKPDEYDLVLTDQNMPEMTGIEMVQQAHTEFPDLPFVILSGYSLEKIEDIIVDHEAIKAFVKKPITRDDLMRTLNDVFEKQKKDAA